MMYKKLTDLSIKDIENISSDLKQSEILKV